jgi:hypothetical protein
MNELMIEIKDKIHGATWRDVWAWLTYASGARLFVAVVSVAYLLWAWL